MCDLDNLFYRELKGSVGFVCGDIWVGFGKVRLVKLKERGRDILVRVIVGVRGLEIEVSVTFRRFWGV